MVGIRDKAPLECKDVNPASSLIQQLLHDVMVVCGTCKSSVKAISYDSHCCTTVQQQEMQLVSQVLHQMPIRKCFNWNMSH